MKKVFILFAFLSSTAFAKSPNFAQMMGKAVCSVKIKASLDSKLQRQTWYPIPVSVPKKHLYFGIAFRDTVAKKAYRIWTDDKQSNVLVADLSTMKETVTTYDAKDCKPVAVTQDVVYPAMDSKEGYSDKDLDATLKAHPWGVIYVWTPYMPLSIEALAAIKKSVADKKGHLTVLLDGKAKTAEAKAWLDKGSVLPTEMTPVASNELYQHEITLHYPVVLLYKDGFLSNRMLTGWKDDKMFSKWIDRELKELGKDLK